MITFTYLQIFSVLTFSSIFHRRNFSLDIEIKNSTSWSNRLNNWRRSSFVIEINLNGKKMRETVGFSHPVVWVAMILAWSSSVALSFGQPLLENVVEPELIGCDAGFTAVTSIWVNGVGFDLVGWASDAAFIFSGDSGGECGKGKEFHFCVLNIL